MKAWDGGAIYDKCEHSHAYLHTQAILLALEAANLSMLDVRTSTKVNTEIKLLSEALAACACGAEKSLHSWAGKDATR